MPKIKTRKSLASRLKITGTNKLLILKKGQNHFNAKDNGSKRSDKRRAATADVSLQAVKRALPSHKW